MAASFATVLLPPPGRANQCRDLSLFCSKRNILQYRFALFVRKLDMIECNIVPVCMDILLAGFFRVFLYFFQTVYLKLYREQLRHI